MGKKLFTRRSALAGSTSRASLEKDYLSGFYDSFAALAATIFAVPLNDLTITELYDNVTGCDTDDDEAAKYCSGIAPKPLLDILNDGFNQYTILALTYLVVMLARWRHIELYSAVVEINISLYLMNCVEVCILTLIPYTLGTMVIYGGHTGGLLYLAVSFGLQLIKHAQTWYLRANFGRPLLVGYADDADDDGDADIGVGSVGSVGAASSSTRMDGGLEAPLLDPINDADDVGYAAADAGAGPTEPSASPTMAVLHHLELFRYSSLLTLVVHVATGTLILLTGSIYSIALLSIMQFLTPKHIDKQWTARLEGKLAKARSASDAVAHRRCIATNKAWRDWHSSLPMPLDRFMGFRDGVYGFLVTAVILTVSPADAGGNDARTLEAYLIKALPYIGAYAFVAVTMLSIYTMSCLTAEQIDARSLGEGPCERPRMQSFIRFGLLGPMLMSIFLPFLALTTNKLFLLGRLAESRTVTIMFVGWYVLTVALSLGCWVAIVMHRDLFAPEMDRNRAAAVLVVCTATLLTALLAIPFIFLDVAQFIFYVLPLNVKLIDWFFADALIKLLWRQKHGSHRLQNVPLGVQGLGAS